MRQGKWSPAYRKTNTYHLEHYLISQFGDFPLRKLETFGIQVWLNGMADKSYSQARGSPLFHQHARDNLHGQETEVSGRRPRRRRDHASDQAG